MSSSFLLLTRASRSYTLRACAALLLEEPSSALSVLGEALRLMLLKQSRDAEQYLLLFPHCLLAQLLQLRSVLGLLILDELFEVGRHDVVPFDGVDAGARPAKEG